MNGASTRKANRAGIAPHLAALLALLACRAHAVPVDGRLEPQYGGARSVQTTQTSLGDPFYGSELDVGFGFVAADTLHLLLGGNYSRFFSEPLIFPNQLMLFIDSRTGGQNPLSAANPSVGHYINLQGVAGLAFDADFEPDFWLAADLETGGADPLFAFYAELPAGGGGAGYYLGRTSMGGPGTLGGSGALNPHGILASIDNSNLAGVTGGCGAGSGEGVTTGIEWAIPLAAIGNPAGAIRVCAMIVSAGGPAQVSNQVLGPVPPGTCGLGDANGVDFASIPGAQYFVIDAPTPAVRTTWGSLKARYR